MEFFEGSRMLFKELQIEGAGSSDVPFLDLEI